MKKTARLLRVRVKQPGIALSFRFFDLDFLEGFTDGLKPEMSAMIEAAVDINKLNRFSNRYIFEMTINGRSIPDICFDRRSTSNGR
jgi:hypothetical protein